MPMYHDGNRELQALFGSTALADRLVERLRRSEFTDDDKAFIESLDHFFHATATPIGQPDCSFKGGPPGETPKRLRANGRAIVSLDDPLITDFPGAQAIIRFTPVDIFPNCPRYIPDPAAAKPSPYIPKQDTPPIEPKWKSMDMFSDVVPSRKA